MKAVGIAIAVVLISACGSTPAANASPTPSSPLARASATPPAGKLIAILRSSNASGSNVDTFDSVAIVGLDGHVRASASFAPMPKPNVGCMGAIDPPSAHTVGDKVYFADGHGVIRSLTADGTTAIVATLPLTSTQQMLSFAISPEATKLLAAIFTAPVNAFPCEATKPAGTYTFDVYAGPVGGSVQRVSHRSWTGPQDVMTFNGWDAAGPLGRFPAVWASQGGGAASTIGVFARIDATTLKATPFSDPTTCFVWSSIATGEYTCTAIPASQSATSARIKTTVNVRTADSHPEWTFNVQDANEANAPFLAPDGHHVVVCCDLDASGEFLVSDTGAQSLLAGGFFAAGWVDATTVFGWTDSTADQPAGMASYVILDAPQTIVKLGTSGRFVGPVAA